MLDRSTIESSFAVTRKVSSTAAESSSRTRGEHYRVLEPPARHAVADAKRNPRVRSQPEARPPTEELTDPVTQPGRSAIAIEEAIESTALRRIALVEAIHRRFVVQCHADLGPGPGLTLRMNPAETGSHLLRPAAVDLAQSPHSLRTIARHRGFLRDGGKNQPAKVAGRTASPTGGAGTANALLSVL